MQRMRFYCRFVCKDNKKVGMLKVIFTNLSIHPLFFQCPSHFLLKALAAIGKQRMMVHLENGIHVF